MSRTTSAPVPTSDSARVVGTPKWYSASDATNSARSQAASHHQPAWHNDARKNKMGELYFKHTRFMPEPHTP